MDGSILLSGDSTIQPTDYLDLNEDGKVDFGYDEESDQLNKAAVRQNVYIHKVGVVLPDIPEL
ncbi:MAG: hypothetical protein ACLFST_09765 [Spirochaetia bacterium]